jgi:hypothetical protein
VDPEPGGNILEFERRIDRALNDECVAGDRNPKRGRKRKRQQFQQNILEK